MDKLVFFLIPIALVATAVILGAGLYSLGRGGTFAAKHSNKLMRLRTAAQAVAVGVMMIFLALIGHGPG
jgi:hypothetical protein